MDFIFLRPLERVMGNNNVSTVMVKASVDSYDNNNLVYDCGNVISNELFHVKAGHIFLETVMNFFHSTIMSGEYIYNGPMVFTNALDKTCSQKSPHKSPINPMNYDQENCIGMKIMKPRPFYPLYLINAKIIQSYAYW